MILSNQEIAAVQELMTLRETCANLLEQKKLDDLIRFGQIRIKGKSKIENCQFKVSIIIPVYNAEKYIKRCVESALFQSYPKIEVLVINDCSKDKTASILSELELVHRNLAVVHRDAQSGGPSIPRMQGIAESSGEYIFFLDSDDWIDGDLIYRLMLSAIDKKSELVFMGGFWNHLSDNSVERRKYRSDYIRSKPNEPFGRYHESFFLWDKLYKKSFIIENNLSLAETKASEEVPFIIKAYYYATQISVVDDLFGYHYSREREGSITVSTRKKVYADYEFVAWGFVKLWARDSCIEANYSKLIDIRMAISLSYAYEISHPEYKRKFFIQMKNEIGDIDLEFSNKFFVAVSWLSKFAQIEGIKKLQFDDYVLRHDISTAKDNRSKTMAFCPDWTTSNPYQSLLYHSLAKNFEIRAAPVAFSEILDDPLAFSQKYRYLHLHWIHGWVDYQNRQKADEALAVINDIKGLGVIVVWTVHNLFVHDTGGAPEELNFRRKLAKIANHVIVHSVHAHDLICKEYGLNSRQNNIIISNHGHYEHVYGEVRDSARSKKVLKLETDSLVIGCIGEIRPYKGVLEFLEVASNLVKKYANVTILVAGACKDKEMSEQLKGYESKNVRINIGRIPDNELRNHICACDIIAIPYKKYLTSGAAILGLTYGKPILYAEGSVSELVNVDEVKLGWSFGDSGDYESLSELLDELMKDTFSTRKHISEMDFGKYLQHDSFSEISKTTLAGLFV